MRSIDYHESSTGKSDRESQKVQTGKRLAVFAAISSVRLSSGLVGRRMILN